MFDQENVREFVNNDREMVTDLRMSSMDWVGSLKHVFVHMLLHFFLAGRLNRQVTSICIFFHWRTQGCYFRVDAMSAMGGGVCFTLMMVWSHLNFACQLPLQKVQFS